MVTFANASSSDALSRGIRARNTRRLGSAGSVIPVCGCAKTGAMKQRVPAISRRRRLANSKRVSVLERDALEYPIVRALDTLVHRFATAEVPQKIVDVIGIGRFDARQMDVNEGRIGIGLIQQVESVG